MGKVKTLLIELEDLGKITWSDKLKTYVYMDDPNKPFILTDYIRKELGKKDERN